MRELCIEKPGNKLDRKYFKDIWSVFIRELPLYTIRIHTYCSQYKADTGVSIKDLKAASDPMQDHTVSVLSSNNFDPLLVKSIPLKKEKNLKDLNESDKGMTGCAAIIYYRRVRHITRNIAQSREDEIWRHSYFVSNNSSIIEGEYTAF